MFGFDGDIQQASSQIRDDRASPNIGQKANAAGAP